MPMSLRVGRLMENCYLLDDGRDGIVLIDPGAEPDKIREALGGHPLRLILITHYHGDHTGAVEALLPDSEMGWMVSEADYAMLAPGRPDVDLGPETPVIGQPPVRLLHDGDVVEVGDLHLRVVATPGHTPGSVVYVDDRRHLAFTGDTLFAGGCGRTDLYGGDQAAIEESLRRLARLPEQAQVLPGHGRVGVIAHELAGNRSLRKAAGLE